MLSAHSWPSFSISSILFFRYVSDYFGKKLRAHLLLSHLPLDFSYYNLNWERVVGEVVISSVSLLFVCVTGEEKLVPTPFGMVISQL